MRFRLEYSHRCPLQIHRGADPDLTNPVPTDRSCGQPVAGHPAAAPDRSSPRCTAPPPATTAQTTPPTAAAGSLDMRSTDLLSYRAPRPAPGVPALRSARLF